MLPSFDTIDGRGEKLHRGVPVRRVGEHLVCTVFDLMLAQYGVSRPGLPGDWPAGYQDVSRPYTPAWQEEITGVSAAQAIRVAREFARNAQESGGRSMIIMGAGICQWFHADATYRAVLSLLILTGSMGRNGGGWAHYVGQEKCRPVTGWAAMAMGTDWSRPPRQVAGTSYWYVHADQWRYDGYRADALSSPVGRNLFTGKHTMDVLASSTAMGWNPFYPQFDRSSLDLADEAAAAGADIGDYVAKQLGSGKLNVQTADARAVDRGPRSRRVALLWRSRWSRRSRGIRGVFEALLAGQVVRLRQESLRRSRAGARLSVALHSPRRHRQFAADRFRYQARQLQIQGLSPGRRRPLSHHEPGR